MKDKYKIGIIGHIGVGKTTLMSLPKTDDIIMVKNDFSFPEPSLQFPIAELKPIVPKPKKKWINNNKFTKNS